MPKKIIRVFSGSSLHGRTLFANVNFTQSCQLTSLSHKVLKISTESRYMTLEFIEENFGQCDDVFFCTAHIFQHIFFHFQHTVIGGKRKWVSALSSKRDQNHIRLLRQQNTWMYYQYNIIYISCIYNPSILCKIVQIFLG